MFIHLLQLEQLRHQRLVKDRIQAPCVGCFVSPDNLLQPDRSVIVAKLL